jgi:hypothetical protein
MNRKLVKDILISELQGLMKLSKEYHDKVKNAKTNTKRQYYKKKLGKNNRRVLTLLKTINRMNEEQSNANAEKESDS